MEERSPEKLELSANAIDHKFSKYLDNFLLEAGNTAKEERVFLARYFVFIFHDKTRYITSLHSV